MWTFASGIICGVIFGGCIVVTPDGIKEHDFFLQKKECEITTQENMLETLKTIPSTEDVVLTIICEKPENAA